MNLYNQRFMESLGRMKNMGEAQETIDQHRYGKVMVPRS
jgi:hypothetical protein